MSTRTIRELDSEHLVGSCEDLLDRWQRGHLVGLLERTDVVLAKAKLAVLTTAPGKYLTVRGQRHGEFVTARDLFEFDAGKRGDLGRELDNRLLSRLVALDTNLAKLIVAHAKETVILKVQQSVLTSASDLGDDKIVQCL